MTKILDSIFKFYPRCSLATEYVSRQSSLTKIIVDTSSKGARNNAASILQLLEFIWRKKH